MFVCPHIQTPVSISFYCSYVHVRIQRGDRGSGPPGKSQVIWVSIEISIWTPPPPQNKLDPPPPRKRWALSGSFKVVCVILHIQTPVSISFYCSYVHVRIQRGDRGSGPPGKSQVIWVSIEISIWTPPSPGTSWTPPPPETLDPLWIL